MIKKLTLMLLMIFSVAALWGTPIQGRINANYRTVPVGTTVEFNFQVTNFGPVSSIQWEFDKGGSTVVTSTSMFPSISYSSPGIYKVKAQVNNGTDLATFTEYNYITVTNADINFTGNEDNNWTIGNERCFNFNFANPMQMYNGSSFWHLNSAGLCARPPSNAISNSDGDLLFYTDDNLIINRRHMRMDNAHVGFQTNHTVNSLIIPVPGTFNKRYFAFFIEDISFNNPVGCEIYYKEVDMAGDHGFGTCVENTGAASNADHNRFNFYSGMVSYHLTAIPHCNGEDYWIIAHDYGSNTVLSFLLTATGISSTPVTSSLGTSQNTARFNYMGSMKGSPQGDRVVLTSGDFSTVALPAIPQVIYETYDFNRNLGTFSNFRDLATGGLVKSAAQFTGGNGAVLYADFSPDGNNIYLTGDRTLRVFQTNAPVGGSISNSQIFLDASFYLRWNQGVALGPNGQVYFSSNQTCSINSAGNIASPNVIGSGCSISAFSFSFGSAGSDLNMSANNAISRYTNFLGIPRDYTICDGNSVSLDGGVGYKRLWDNGDTGRFRTITAPGYYSIRVVKNNCTFRLSIRVRPQINVQLTGEPFKIECGEEYTLDAGAGYSEYKWNDNSTNRTLGVYSKGIYSVKVKSGTCSQTLTTFIDGDACCYTGGPYHSYQSVYNMGDYSEPLRIRTNADNDNYILSQSELGIPYYVTRVNQAGVVKFSKKLTVTSANFRDMAIDDFTKGVVTIGQNATHIILTNIDNTGAILWDKTYDVNAFTGYTMTTLNITSLIQTHETTYGLHDGYLAVATAIDASGNAVVMAIKFDYYGSIIWHKIYKPSNIQPNDQYYSSSAIELKDGSGMEAGYLILARLENSVNGNYRSYAFTINDAGATTGVSGIFPNEEIYYGVVQSFNGSGQPDGFIFTGAIGDIEHSTDMKPLILKTNQNLNSVLAKKKIDSYSLQLTNIVSNASHNAHDILAVSHNQTTNKFYYLLFQVDNNLDIAQSMIVRKVYNDFNSHHFVYYPKTLLSTTNEGGVALLTQDQNNNFCVAKLAPDYTSECNVTTTFYAYDYEGGAVTYGQNLYKTGNYVPDGESTTAVVVKSPTVTCCAEITQTNDIDICAVFNPSIDFTTFSTFNDFTITPNLSNNLEIDEVSINYNDGNGYIVAPGPNYTSVNPFTLGKAMKYNICIKVKYKNGCIKEYCRQECMFPMDNLISAIIVGPPGSTDPVIYSFLNLDNLIYGQFCMFHIDWGDGAFSDFHESYIQGHNIDHAYPRNTSHQICITVTYASGCVKYWCFMVNTLVTDDQQLSITGDKVTYEKLKNSMRIYPNPSQGLFTMALQRPYFGKATIEIYNTIGQQVVTKVFEGETTGKYTIDLNDQPSGIYTVKLIAGTDVITSQVSITH